MLVTRWENEQGTGVYQARNILNQLSYEEVKCEVRHPLPIDDFGLEVYHLNRMMYGHNGTDNESVKFGFTTDEMEAEWFSEYACQTMLELGGVRRVYEVPENRVVWSQRQCVFDPGSAVLVGETRHQYGTVDKIAALREQLATLQAELV